MAARYVKTGACPKIKEEAKDNDYAGTPEHEKYSAREPEHIARLRQMARKLAADAGFSTANGGMRAGGDIYFGSDVGPKVNKDGGVLDNQLQVKTPK